MNKISLLIVRIVCLGVVACFFSTYFVISCSGLKVNISGMEAAFGIDKNDIPLDPSPMLMLIPGIALVVLVALSIPPVRKKLECAKLPIKNVSIISGIPIIGGITGLILLANAHYAVIGKVQKEMGGYDISSIYHTGFGFKASVFAYIVMFVMPFVDKMLLKKITSQQNNSASE